MRTCCDWCHRIIRVADGSVHTNENVIICDDKCAESEIQFRHTYTDENIDRHHPNGQWIKEIAQWIKE